MWTKKCLYYSFMVIVAAVAAVSAVPRPKTTPLDTTKHAAVSASSASSPVDDVLVDVIDADARLGSSSQEVDREPAPSSGSSSAWKRAEEDEDVLEIVRGDVDDHDDGPEVHERQVPFIGSDVDYCLRRAAHRFPAIDDPDHLSTAELMGISKALRSTSCTRLLARTSVPRSDDVDAQRSGLGNFTLPPLPTLPPITLPPLFGNKTIFPTQPPRLGTNFTFPANLFGNFTLPTLPPLFGNLTLPPLFGNLTLPPLLPPLFGNFTLPPLFGNFTWPHLFGNLTLHSNPTPTEAERYAAEYMRMNEYLAALAAHHQQQLHDRNLLNGILGALVPTTSTTAATPTGLFGIPCLPCPATGTIGVLELKGLINAITQCAAQNVVTCCTCVFKATVKALFSGISGSTTPAPLLGRYDVLDAIFYKK